MAGRERQLFNINRWQSLGQRWARTPGFRCKGAVFHTWGGKDVVRNNFPVLIKG